MKFGIQAHQEIKVYVFILKLFEKLRFVLCQANHQAERLYRMVGISNKAKDTEDRQAKSGPSIQDIINSCIEYIEHSKYNNKSTNNHLTSYERYKVMHDRQERQRQKDRQPNNEPLDLLIINDSEQVNQLDRLLIHADKFTKSKHQHRSIKLDPYETLTKFLMPTIDDNDA